MRKLMLMVGLVMCAAVARANVITNTVVIVSNIYNNVYSEHVITQKVQNTHYEYYFTNNVYTVSNVTLLVSKTNQTVYLDVGRSFVIAASNEANRASGSVTDAQGYASQSAGSASSAASSASSASSYANQAASQRSAAASECATALQTINNRIAWFDEHSGETITMVDNSTNYVVYVPEQDYSYPYVDAQGRTYNYVTVHPYNVNGKVSVAARSSSSYNTVTFRAWPAKRLSGWWDFYPAYIDNDEYGMRIQYLPTTTEPVMYGDSNSAYPNGKQVPEYFYWQNGYIYFKVRVWENGRVVAWCISRYKYDNYPTTINYGTDTGTAMTLVDRELYGPSSFNNAAYLYSKTRENQGVALNVSGTVLPSYEPVLEWMRNGPLVSELEQRVIEAENQVQQFGTDFGARITTAEGTVAALGTRVGSAETTIGEHATAIGRLVGDVVRLDSDIQAISNRVEDIESGSPHPYEHGGTVYSRITVYKTAQDNGKVSADPTSSSYYAAASYKLTPAYRYPTTTVGTWTFVPAYADTDANGLRLHYVPTEIKAIRYSSSSTRWLVPEYLYWQNGYVYAKIKTYVDGEYDNGYVIGRVQDSNFPNYSTTAKTVSRTSYNSWSSSSLGTIVGTSQVTPSGTAVWFAETASPSIVPIISWMLTGK